MTTPPSPPPPDDPRDDLQDDQLSDDPLGSQFPHDPLADGPPFPPPPPAPDATRTVPQTPPSSQTPPVPPPAKPRRTGRTILLIVLLVLIVAALLWTWASVTFAYSSAEQRGYVQTLSRSGWLCKTWEGELIVTSQTPGFTGPSVMRFTVRDDSVAKSLQQAVGLPVVLQYDQHRGVPSSCFGDTQTFVTGFRTIP